VLQSAAMTVQSVLCFHPCDHAGIRATGRFMAEFVRPMASVRFGVMQANVAESGTASNFARKWNQIDNLPCPVRRRL